METMRARMATASGRSVSRLRIRSPTKQQTSDQGTPGTGCLPGAVLMPRKGCRCFRQPQQAAQREAHADARAQSDGQRASPGRQALAPWQVPRRRRRQPPAWAAPEDEPGPRTARSDPDAARPHATPGKRALPGHARPDDQKERPGVRQAARMLRTACSDPSTRPARRADGTGPDRLHGLPVPATP